MSSTEDINDKDSDDEYDSESERTKIREELTSLSFEELQKLKERMGTKVYNEALFGKQKTNNNKSRHYKRENKNRPREISSKRPVSMIREASKAVVNKNSDVRDPRFDPLCGVFDKKQFKQDYSFLADQRKKDLKAVMKEFKETDDPTRKMQCRKLIQRLKDKMRSEKRDEIEKESNEKQRQSIDEDLRSGKQPHFASKSERRVESLVKQYEELKNEGSSRIQRHLKRRQQKIKKKSYYTPVGDN